MKRLLFAVAALVLAVSCSPKLYNVTKSYDDAHFAKLQSIIDNPATTDETVYSYTEASDIGLIGKVSYQTANPYHRFDTTAYKGMTVGERCQAISPAGVAVAFSTNSSSISLKAEWGWMGKASRNTMPVSYRGFDLYIKDNNGKWVWAAANGTASSNPVYEVTLAKNLPAGVKECILYLPIYTEIKSLKIGVTVGSYIQKLEGQFRNKIMFHGSSFTQGISTSRAGMSYPMQFMRNTGMQVIAFGMSGNCKMQPYFAEVVADTEADAYVFDAFSNPDYLMIKERLQPFIDRIIEAHPGKPLIFQQTIYREGRNFNVVSDAKEQAKQDMASTLFDQLLKDPKYKDVYFIQTRADEGLHEYSVDGTHPDDHGYYIWYKSIETPVLKILEKYGIK